MASFTDQISQFNPYIKQLPVEAMTQVGMYKQQKYDEGVQKVQGYIDSVAGMDVARDIDKAYLQGKLNELGSKLKTVAAGDFSNYQLVNSVGGMATQIAKDPFIQEAVTSTKYLRKGEDELEQARKAGKSSPQNEAWWREQEVGSWLNNNKLGSAFRGRFTEYTDMEKKLRDVAKEVHEYDNTIESPFIRDNLGRTLYFYKNAKGEEVATLDPTKGTSKVDEAILKMRVKGKSAQKILDNFYMSLDENDKKQLGIDGWYHYKGVSGDQLKAKVKNDILDTYKLKKKSISEEIVKLSVELSNNSNLTAEQKELKTARLTMLQELSKGKGLDKQLNDELTAIDSRDELSLKQSVYTEKFLTSLSSNIAYQDMETEYKTNPYERAIMDKKKLEFDYWNAQRQQQNENRNYALAVSRENREIAKDAREAAKAYAEMYGAAPTWESSGLTTDKEVPTIENLSSDINNLNKEMEEFRVKNISKLVKNSGNMTEAEQRQALTDRLNAYLKNPKSVEDNNERKLLERYRSMSTDMTRRTFNYLEIYNKSKVYDTQLAEALKNTKPITDKSGTTYTAEDASNVLNDIRSSLALIERKTKEGPTYVKDWSKAIQKYKGTRYEGLLKDIMNDETYLRKFNNDVGAVTSKILGEKKAFQQREIGKIMPQFQTAVSSLNMEEKNTSAAVDKVIGEMYGLYDSLGSLNVESKEKFDPNTISKWRSEKGAGDLKYVLRKAEDNSSAYLEIYKGSEVQKIPLNQRQFQKYFPTAAQVNPMENIKYMVMGSPNKTTNAMSLTEDSPRAAINAAFTGENLPLIAGTGIASLVRYDIEGDEDNIGDENDRYQIRMYVNDNGIWKSDIVNKQGFATYSGVSEVLRNIGVTEYTRIKNLK